MKPIQRFVKRCDRSAYKIAIEGDFMSEEEKEIVEEGDVAANLSAQ